MPGFDVQDLDSQSVNSAIYCRAIETGKWLVFWYNIAIKKSWSNQSRKIFKSIEYADFNVWNEERRTDADAKTNM